MYSIHRLAVLMEARCVICVVFSMQIRCVICTRVTRFTIFLFVLMQKEWEGIFYRVVFFPALPVSAGATLPRPSASVASYAAGIGEVSQSMTRAEK